MSNKIRVNVPSLEKIFYAYDEANDLLWDHFKEIDNKEALNFLTIPEEDRPDKRTRNDIFLPAIVMLAFTVELGLKILLYREEKKWNYKHDLKEIFALLSASLQQKIKEEVCQQASISETMFDERLNDNKDTFIQWRYFFEKEKVKVNREFLSRLKEAIVRELS